MKQFIFTGKGFLFVSFSQQMQALSAGIAGFCASRQYQGASSALPPRWMGKGAVLGGPYPSD